MLRKGRFDLTCHQRRLLFLGHGHELMIWIEIRLDQDDIKRFPALTIGMPLDGRPYHGSEKDQDGGYQGSRSRFAPQPGESSVGESGHQPENSQIRRPYPQGSAKAPQGIIPLRKPYGSGKCIAEDEPGPGDLGDCQIILFPCNPGCGKENIRQDSLHSTLGPAEKAENQ